MCPVPGCTHGAFGKTRGVSPAVSPPPVRVSPPAIEGSCKETTRSWGLGVSRCSAVGTRVLLVRDRTLVLNVQGERRGRSRGGNGDPGGSPVGAPAFNLTHNYYISPIITFHPSLYFTHGYISPQWGARQRWGERGAGGSWQGQTLLSSAGKPRVKITHHRPK